MNLKAYVAEFVGTFALVFVAVGSMAADHITGGGVGLVGIALANGLTIAAMATATAAVSNGHLNPAVTFGVLLVRKIDPTNAVGYVVSQCLGGIAAVLMLKQCIPAAALQAVKMGTPTLGDGVTTGMGVALEIMLTFFLVFVIFGTAFDPRAPRLGALFIGLAVTLDILVGGPITGAAMNPARHLGPALLGGGMQDTWLYWVGPLVGSGVAALLYHHVLAER